MAGVGFDLDHTLAIDNKLERVAFLRLLEELLERGGRALGSIFEESDRIDALLARQREGACSIDDAVEEFVVEHGLSADPAYAARFRSMAQAMVDQFVVPLPGVKDTLGSLHARGIPVAVLSNGWNPLQVLKARRAGFDGPVLASADIGERKPCAGAFEALLRALGTRAHNTWYVGDDPRGDVAGAREHGLHAVWLDDEKKAYPAELAPPSHTIHSVDEILHVLPAVSP